MGDQITGNGLQPLLRANHRFEGRPFRFQLLFPLDFLPLRNLVELGIDLRSFGRSERKVGEPALVIDGHRRPVLHGALAIIDADGLAEDRARVLVRQFDRRAREADERGVWQGIAQMMGEAVDEVVLAARRLVRDHHTMAPVGQERRAIAFRPGSTSEPS
jgi:hypothetical protein